VTTALGAKALDQQHIATAPIADVMGWLETTAKGLSTAEAANRLARVGPNSVRTHRVSAVAVLRRQLNNAVLGLLAITAVLSFFLGDSTQAVIIGIILAVSVGLSFVNEYRAERATAALHDRVRHNAVAYRDGRRTKVDVSALVPGDVIQLELGQLIPADVRLIEVNGLECNESNAEPMRLAGQPHRTRSREHRVHRRASRFSHPGRLPSPT
jgi:Mg2+-importing ATPase